MIEFTAFFEALWGYPPFDWQARLAARVASMPDANWPEAIALGTGSGKTACIDIAVFALAKAALEANHPGEIRTPRRIFYTVDRRLLVDEAARRAARIATALEKSTSGILYEAANGLRRVASVASLASQKPPCLAVHSVRGGNFRSDAWAKSPVQPTVISTTIDQLGSRLLFRAWGGGAGMRPVYAGLVANDSLILVDEAHCSEPFVQTIQAVHRFREWAEEPLQRSFQSVVISATPPPALQPFVDESHEAQDPNHPLGKRLLASKPATLEIEADGKDELYEKRLAERAEKLLSDDRRAIVIFVNRVATARNTHALLQQRHGHRALLLTGRMRGIDRDLMTSGPLAELQASSSATRELDQPMFVVATQTLEVGADLDFDGLVTECANLDALRQRFGRLNRMGRTLYASGTIVIRKEQAHANYVDPIYGAALSATWDWLIEQRSEASGTVDFGSQALHDRLPEADVLRTLAMPATNAPVMLPAHLDALAQTRPEPQPSPEVALFLRGPQRRAAMVQICLRLHPCEESLGLCPPASSECAGLPLSHLKRWIAGGGGSDLGSDIEGAAEHEHPTGERGNHGRTTEIWHRLPGQLGFKPLGDASQLRPDAVVVLPADAPALTKLIDFPESDFEHSPASLDIGDTAALLARAKPILRINPQFAAQWPDGQARQLAIHWHELDDGNANAVLASAQETLAALANEAPAGSHLQRAASSLHTESHSPRFTRCIHRLANGDILLRGRRLVRAYLNDATTFNDDTDLSASGTQHRSGKPVLLHEHLAGVASVAHDLAEALGLPPELSDAIGRAGRLHDLGKIDPRFQTLLQAGNRFACPNEPLAKSGNTPQSHAAAQAARAASDYPEGARHELLSVRLAEVTPGLLPTNPELSDLILHLVASHHGYCRPLAPVVVDHDPPSVSVRMFDTTIEYHGETRLEQLDSGVSDRFWSLTARYGWWGLAWLEAILRLADHRRSEWEELND